MSLRVDFDLSDEDLQYFRRTMRSAKAIVTELHEDEIINAMTTGLLDSARQTTLPGFIAQRLDKLDILVHMLRDQEWQLPPVDRRRVLSAMAYFVDPEDMIADRTPGLGFLDDAIFVELVVRQLKHEIEAYQDFCTFRTNEEQRRARRGEPTHVGREQWLADRRAVLHSRMRRRRESGSTGWRLKMF